jgi:hypothetical protein
MKAAREAAVLIEDEDLSVLDTNLPGPLDDPMLRSSRRASAGPKKREERRSEQGNQSSLTTRKS